MDSKTQVRVHSTFGVTGWCGLDLNRDRIPHPYEIWSYARTTSNTTVALLVGTLDPVKHEVSFYESLGARAQVRLKKKLKPTQY